MISIRRRNKTKPSFLGSGPSRSALDNLHKGRQLVPHGAPVRDPNTGQMMQKMVMPRQPKMVFNNEAMPGPHPRLAQLLMSNCSPGRAPDCDSRRTDGPAPREVSVEEDAQAQRMQMEYDSAFAAANAPFEMRAGPLDKEPVRPSFTMRREMEPSTAFGENWTGDRIAHPQMQHAPTTRTDVDRYERQHDHGLSQTLPAQVRAGFDISSEASKPLQDPRLCVSDALQSGDSRASEHSIRPAGTSDVTPAMVQGSRDTEHTRLEQAGPQFPAAHEAQVSEERGASDTWTRPARQSQGPALASVDDHHHSQRRDALPPRHFRTEQAGPTRSGSVQAPEVASSRSAHHPRAGRVEQEGKVCGPQAQERAGHRGPSVREPTAQFEHKTARSSGRAISLHEAAGRRPNHQEPRRLALAPARRMGALRASTPVRSSYHDPRLKKSDSNIAGTGLRATTEAPISQRPAVSSRGSRTSQRPTQQAAPDLLDAGRQTVANSQDRQNHQELEAPESRMSAEVPDQPQIQPSAQEKPVTLETVVTTPVVPPEVVAAQIRDMRMRRVKRRSQPAPQSAPPQPLFALPETQQACMPEREVDDSSTRDLVRSTAFTAQPNTVMEDMRRLRARRREVSARPLR